jgi:hypothetical protein
MSKGNRQRSKKEISKNASSVQLPTKPKTIYDEFNISPLEQKDADFIKSIFNISNNVSALIKDYSEKEISVKNMRIVADDIEREKQPLIMQVTKNLFKSIGYKGIAKQMREQAELLEKTLVLSKGQIGHRYEDYVSSLIRLKRFIDGKVEGIKLPSITGYRSDEKTSQEEEILFEKDFEKDSKLSDVEKKQLENIQKLINDKKTEKNKK